MGLFNSRRPTVAEQRVEPSDQIPIMPIDLSKRYDVYCTELGHDRLYEDVRFVAIRTFERLTQYSSGLVGGYLEIEVADGANCLIPSFGIRLICEHGTQPTYKVLRRRRNSWD
jgi:hypothetical protein